MFSGELHEDTGKCQQSDDDSGDFGQEMKDPDQKGLSEVCIIGPFDDKYDQDQTDEEPDDPVVRLAKRLKAGSTITARSEFLYLAGSREESRISMSRLLPLR